MAMTPLQRKQSALLTATVRYYSKDPKGRRAANNGFCSYIDKKERRCAIGRLLNKETAAACNTRGGNVDFIWSYLPDKVTAYGRDFLRALQIFHDRDCFWTKTGLSYRGRERVDFLRRCIAHGRF